MFPIETGDRVTMNPQTDGGMVGEELIGGLAERFVFRKNLVPLPENVSFETGAAVPITMEPPTECYSLAASLKRVR